METKNLFHEESWFFKCWRPAMAWSYLTICLFDFLLGPVFYAIVQGMFFPGQPMQQWHPNTLSEGGLYHIAMMAIVGVAAWSRGQEKLKMMGLEYNIETETVQTK